jgi:hypothetical protein
MTRQLTAGNFQRICRIVLAIGKAGDGALRLAAQYQRRCEDTHRCEMANGGSVGEYSQTAIF